MELLTVIAIASIVMAMAAPTYRSLTASYRISGEVNGLLGDLQFARAEAIKEGQSVTVCVANSTGTACSGATGWQGGWIVFSDPTGSKTPGTTGATVVLRWQAPFTGTDTFDNTTTSVVFFNRDGLITGLPGAGAVIPLHDSTANATRTRCLQMSNVGAILVTQPSTNASCT